MPVINSISALTELDAVNESLAAIGEAPLPAGTNLSTATQQDVTNAIQILRRVTREVQSIGWRFNTEFGYELAPTTTYSWVDTGGTTTLLNIFTPPATLAAFRVTPIHGQVGGKLVDTEIAPSRKYTPGTLVFRDRDKSRDGFAQADHPYLYIDPVWFMDFESMPQIARQYVSARAARVFAESAVGSETLSKFVRTNESQTYRALKIDQGIEDTHSFLNASERAAIRGGRPGYAGIHVNRRRNRGSV